MSVLCLFSILVPSVIERNCVLDPLGKDPLAKMLALGICPSAG